MKKPTKQSLVLIDGNSLINRAYYAIQRPMLTQDGLYTQAVYGFLTILDKIIREHVPYGVVTVFDRKAPTFRHLEYKEYKATRKGMPPELAMQMPILHDVLGALRIPILEMDGFEADDIIGTVVKQAEAAGYSVLVITGDRDALQLASEQTEILITRKGISEFDLYDRDTIMETYGLTPGQIVDLKGLMGDASDNIPGLPGVGEKTALALLAEFGSVENLLQKVDDIASPKMRQKIRENEQIARLSRRLAEINTAVPIATPFAEWQLQEPDYPALIELYKRLEFRSFLKKLPPAAAAAAYQAGQTAGQSTLAAGQPASAEQPDLTADQIAGQSADPRLPLPIELTTVGWPTFQAAVKPGSRMALKVFSDEHHRQTPTICAVSLALAEPAYYACLTEPSPAIRRELGALLNQADLRLSGHYFGTDQYALRAAWLPGWDQVPAFDSAIAQYLLQPGRRGYDLPTLTLEYLNRGLVDPKAPETADHQLMLLTDPTPDYAETGRQWCAAVLDLEPLLLQGLAQAEMTRVFTEVELPLIPVLVAMEEAGFKVDPGALEQAGDELAERIEQLQAMIYAAAGQEFNINSPKQLGEILFEKLGLATGKKTKTGYSTDADTLDRLRQEHPIVEQILEYRTVSKLKGTYVDGLLPLIHQDGRIHAHFQQTVAATGRISCTEPNLQNIPIRQEQGRLLRKAFVPTTKEGRLISADYSQIELRLLADQADDPIMIESFNRQEDIHRTTAARVFNVPAEEVTPILRSSAKAVNFGIIYGMSSFGLSTGLNISRRKAEDYIRAYFAIHPKVKAYLDRQVELARKTGYTTTILGRRRPIPEIRASNHMIRQAGERLAMNSPLQGSAADIIKIAMIRCYAALKERGLKSRLILQVHDELIIDATADEIAEVSAVLRETMEAAVQLKVDLIAETNIGANWYELK